MFSVLVIRLRSLRLLRVSGIVMRLRMFLLLITFLKASHSFRNRLLVICKNAYLFATMIMTSVSSPFSCCSGTVRLNLMRPFLATSPPLAPPPSLPATSFRPPLSPPPRHPSTFPPRPPPHPTPPTPPPHPPPP